MKRVVQPALSRSRRGLSRAESIGLAAIVLTMLAWAMLPATGQDPGYHHFADQREWLGVPRAADVLSNLAFALVGFAGVIRLASRRRPRFAPATDAGLWCIALGLVLTAIGSAWYHRDPNNATLVWDRLPMTLVFAGVLGAAIAQRIGSDVGRVALSLLVPLGVLSVLYWNMTGDLALYLAVQFGGIGGVLLLLVLTRKGNDPFPWAWVLAWYALAKIVEYWDRPIWDATHGLIAGHTLKHLLAAVAGAALLWPLRARR